MEADQMSDQAQPVSGQHNERSNSDEARRLMASFGEIVTLMTRSPRYRHSFLAELDWLVTPAIATRQYSVAESKPDGASFATPIAAIMWACVSPEIDARLSEAGERPRLRPGEWRSGPIPWLIDTIGDPRAAAVLLKRLADTRFPDTGVKTMVQANGKYTVELARSAGDQAPAPVKRAGMNGVAETAHA
jgi:hemolysin-activating ACP:hemolysin acyltransferase